MVGMIWEKDRFYAGSEREREFWMMKEMEHKQWKWRKQKQKEKSQRWNEVVVVKEEAGSRDMVKHVEKSDQ